jgi:hypothetical protein
MINKSIRVLRSSMISSRTQANRVSIRCFATNDKRWGETWEDADMEKERQWVEAYEKLEA